jgi:hypothetical protein
VDHHRDCFNRYKRADMVLIVRLEENDFITRIQQRSTGTVEGAGCPNADGDFGFRIGANPVIVAQLVCDGLP